MCGIVGYIGKRDAQSILLEGLNRLEYRGYDSAGVAVITNTGLETVKSLGRLAALEAKTELNPLQGASGIGHTRWATHGKPSDRNSHPHTDNSGRFAIVHNGIIENYMQLKEELMMRGHRFASETDTEVIVHLIAEQYKALSEQSASAGIEKSAIEKLAVDDDREQKGTDNRDNDRSSNSHNNHGSCNNDDRHGNDNSYNSEIGFSMLADAVRRAVQQLKGAYALGIMSEYEPDKLIAVRQASPLIIGVGEKESFIGSDISAILSHTRSIYILDDGEMAILTANKIELSTLDGTKVSKEIQHIDWDLAAAEKAGYDHFMLKEIYEQPRAYRDTMRGFLQKNKQSTNLITLQSIGITEQQIKSIDRVQIVACGTAYHAGLAGRNALEQLARIPTEAEAASEYRYRQPIITPTTLVIAVSQSGETADTLAALREAQKNGAKVLAITNVIGSTISREADYVYLTGAGPEIAVASTKAYTAQLIAFSIIALHFAMVRSEIQSEEAAHFAEQIRKLPEQAEQLLQQTAQLQQLGKKLAQYKDLFFIGRGIDYAVAQEGSLKLKEISYIHSEAYAAGELKHGTLALIEQGTPVIAIVTQDALYEKTVSNIKEVIARGASVIAVASGHLATELSAVVDEVISIPATHALLTPALSVIPLQLLSYYTALALEHDIDKPRNLAKSVTVE